jgi:hypothetical protein
MSEHNWSVWVGGVEVNDYMLSAERARLVANWYISNGYDDVAVEQYDEREKAP